MLFFVLKTVPSRAVEQLEPPTWLVSVAAANAPCSRGRPPSMEANQKVRTVMEHMLVFAEQKKACADDVVRAYSNDMIAAAAFTFVRNKSECSPKIIL